MNNQILKNAHFVAAGIILLGLIVGIAISGQTLNRQSLYSALAASPQNQNSNSNRNSNRNSNSNSNRSANSNSGMSMGNANSTAGSTLSSNDRKFVVTAAMDGMTEVQLGRLATQQGASADVKQFGQRMVDDHSQANTELTQLASAQGITLPTALDAKHQALVTKMSALSGAAFDKEYSKLMVKDHKSAVSLFQKESTGGPTGLRDFASKTLPTLQGHLTMAQSMATATGGGNSNSNNNRNGNSNGNNNGNSNTGR